MNVRGTAGKKRADFAKLVLFRRATRTSTLYRRTKSSFMVIDTLNVDFFVYRNLSPSLYLLWSIPHDETGKEACCICGSAQMSRG